MTNNLPPTLTTSILTMTTKNSIIHQIVSDDRARRIDAAMLADKQVDGYAQRSYANAMRLQLQRQGQPGSWS